jgi:hypothetical protein
MKESRREKRGERVREARGGGGRDRLLIQGLSRRNRRRRRLIGKE